MMGLFNFNSCLNALGVFMIHEVDTIQLKGLIESPDNQKNHLVVDCREQGEWDQVRIEGTIFIPLSKMNENIAEIVNQLAPFKEKKLYIHCRSGKRSMTACELLNDYGFENLYNIEGGILAWIENGYPTI